jgi:tripartite-type tricarboxylate transporter receptor subunit TctC
MSRRNRIERSLQALSMLALVSATQMAAAQSGFPNKPLRLICAYTPGGSIDLTGRPLAQGMSELLGQQVIYENKPGANGNVGAAMVAKAAPDGYTLLIASTSQLTINPSLYPDMPFDVARELAPITLISMTPTALVLHPSVQANTLKEVLAYARSNPTALRYASAGNGSINHLATELMKINEKVDMLHVPYKGSGPALAAVVAGEVNTMIASVPPAIPFIKSGRIKVIALSADKRFRLLPEVPTIAEAGGQGFQASAGIGLLAPGGTPRPAITRLQTTAVKVVNSPDIGQKLLSQGVELIGSTPEEFAALIKEESARWDRVVRAGNIKPD